MRLHKENIFRYLLACFLVAAFGLFATWKNTEKEREMRIVSKTEASLSLEGSLEKVPADRSSSSEHQ